MADLLKANGYSVWWDFEIEGGSRFSAAIERALKGADAVVVLWSATAVGSPWVQDEAAAGRDSNRLVPVRLDQAEPPLGFRQYQSIDLTDWSGRGTPRQMARIVSAIAALTGGAHAPAMPEPPLRAIPAGPGRLWPAFIGAILVLAFVVTFTWLRTGRAEAAPSVTVTASSAAPGQRSAAMAHDVALDLGRYQTGPLGGLSIAEAPHGAARATDYRVEVGVTPGESGEHADIALLDRGSSVVWTTAVDTPPNRDVDLRQQASAQVGAVLACAIHANQMRPKPTREVLNLYLTGCARITSASSDRTDEVGLSIFRKITEKEPRLAEGWAGLALLECWSIIDADEAQIPMILRTAREHLNRAEQINPKLDLVSAAEARINPVDTKYWGLALEALDRGLKWNPDSGLLNRERSEVLEHIGRMDESVDSARRAVEFDPLSPKSNDEYISALAYSGREPAARRELERAERIWPGSAVMVYLRYRFDMRYGDAANAQRLLKEQGDLIGLDDNPALEAFAAARISPTTENKDKAIAAFRDLARRNPGVMSQMLQALGTFNRVDEAYAALQTFPMVYMIWGSDILWRPDMAPIRRDPRFMALSSRMGLVRLWRQTKIWPDFCSDPKLPYDCKTEAAKYS